MSNRSIKIPYRLSNTVSFLQITLLMMLIAVALLNPNIVRSQSILPSTQKKVSQQFGSPDTNFAAVLSQARYSPGVSQAYALPSGKILVAGGFKVVNGIIKQNLVRLNSDGTLDNSFGITLGSTSQNFPATRINQILIQPDGKILIGGSFNSVNNIEMNNLARINDDGTLDQSFDIGDGFNSIVTSLALQADNKILVGGDFSAFDGTTRRYLARVNPNGSLDTLFNATISSFFINTIKSISPQPDGKILIQGRFNQVSSQSRRGFARLNVDGTIDESFEEPGIYNSFNGMNTFVVRPDGKIYIGGSFEIRVNNNPVCHNLCLLNTDGTLDISYFVSFGSNSGVNTLYLQDDGRLLVHGGFSSINGSSQNGNVRLNSDGGVDDSFNPNFKVDYGGEILSDGKINAFVPLPSGDYIIPGDYTRVNNITFENLAKIDSNGNVDTSFTPHFALLSAFSRTSVIQPDGKILVAGDFNRANGVLRRRMARFNSDGTLDLSFNASISNGFPGTVGFEDVNKIVVQTDGKILIGGAFGQVNGEEHRFLARLNSDGSLDSDFNPIITFQGSGGGRISSMKIQSDGKIIIGGAFQTVNGIERKGHARLNPDGSLDNSFVIPFDPSYAPSLGDILIQPDGKILIGGDFRFDGNSSIYSVARLNVDGSLDTSFVFPSDVNTLPYIVESLAMQPNGKIIVGGTGNSQNRPVLVRLSQDGSIDESFIPEKVGIGFSSDKIFSIIVLPNGKILIAGSFSRIGNITRFNIARLVENGKLDFSFSSPPLRLENSSNPPSIQSLNQTADGNLIIAGLFDRIGDEFVSGFGLLPVINITQPIFDFDGDSKTDVSIFRPGPGQWWYLRSSDLDNRAYSFGTNTDKLVPADFTGDGKTDIAFWRPSSGEWFVLRSEDSSFYSVPFGTSGDIPAPGDFDGDGKADTAVFRPANATWFIQRSSDNGTTIQGFGIMEDKPTVADYDGDGKDDIAIFRPSLNQWWQLRSSGGVIAYQFGATGDKTVQGDYTGDGKADVAIFRPSNGNWFILRSEDASFYAFPFGLSTDIPTPGDYDGDGKMDAAVFRPSNNTWFIQGSTSGSQQVGFGIAGDIPLSSVYSVP